MRSAPLFQLVMTPSSVLLTMASSADSMMAASQYGAKSGRCIRVSTSPSLSPSGAGVRVGSLGIRELVEPDCVWSVGGVGCGRLYSPHTIISMLTLLNELSTFPLNFR